MYRTIVNFKSSVARCRNFPQRLRGAPALCPSYRYFADKPSGDVDQAEVLIIGGGVVGSSIAYHLAKNGQKGVVLLEKTELTAGSTWHAAGLTAYFHPGVNLKRVQYDSLQLYSTLYEETGQDIGFHRCGSIRLAATPARFDEFRYQMARQGWHDAPQRLISPEETKQLHPLLNTDNILAGLYNEMDGYVDPYSLTHALSIGARKNGAKFLVNTGVSSMKQKSDGGWEINTTKGHIQAKTVVNAGGFWAREIGELVGIDLPVVAAHHTYMVTSPIPEVEALDREPPVLRDLDASCYVRVERSGLLVGPYESEEKMTICEDWYDNGVPPGFGKELFEGDLEKLNEYVEKLMENLPIIGEASIRNVICGPITYAPENIPIVGPYPGLANYWTAIGFGYGIVHSGGIGKYLAEWIMKGEPAYDLIETDPCRFGKWTDRTFLMSKVRESYGLNNIIIYPKEERPAGRPTKRQSPLYKIHQEEGGQFGFKTGWEQANWFAFPGDDPGYSPSFHRTNWFEPVRREVTMVREGVGLIDLTPSGKFQIKGEDAEKLLDYIFANELPKLNDFRNCFALTAAGKVYAENLVVRQDSNQFLCVTGHLTELHDLRHIQNVVREQGLNVEIKNLSDEMSCLGLAGPMSHAVLAKLTNQQPASGNCFTFKLEDHDVLVVGASLTGEQGFELYTDNNNTEKLYRSLKRAGKEFHIGNFGAFAYNTLRIESGTPAWGSDMKLDYNVLESRLENRIDADKPSDYLGKSSVHKLRQTPLEQELVLLSLTTENVDPEGNETVWFEDKVIGHTTSGCYGYTVSKSLAFAYVPPRYASSDSQVYVELLGNKYQATVLSGSPLEKDTAERQSSQSV